MAKAKITLTGALTMSKGRYRFTKNQTVVSDDDALIRECEADGQFAVTRMEDDKKPAKKTKAKDEESDDGADDGKKKDPPAPSTSTGSAPPKTAAAGHR